MIPNRRVQNMKETRSNALLAEAFVDNKASLTSYISTFFVQQEEIEDTLQQTFLKTMVSDSKTEIQSLKAYLFRVARNIALNKITRQKKIFFENIGFIDDAMGSKLADVQSQELSDQVYTQKKLEAFTFALASLPPQCRKVFLMQRVAGFTYKEISAQLGISVRTVEKHLEKGLKRCAEYLVKNGFPVFEGNAKTSESWQKK